MKIGFSGTQSGMNQFQRSEFLKLLAQFKPHTLHHGDCIGADAQAHLLFLEWHAALDNNPRYIVIHPPIKPEKRAYCNTAFNRIPEQLKEKLLNCKWKIQIITREPRAYLERNKDIVNDTDMLIAAPKEIDHTLRSGTWATIRHGWHTKKQVIVVPPLEG